jgi:hypothetical protein
MLTKTCILCPDKIRPKHRLCAKCYKLYYVYTREEWFRELEHYQYRQDVIDRKESSILSDNTAATITGTLQKRVVIEHKPVGRPSTAYTLVDKVLNLYDQSIESGKPLSLRKIQSVLNNKVKYLTVRRILKAYRKNTFPYKKKKG